MGRGEHAPLPDKETELVQAAMSSRHLHPVPRMPGKPPCWLRPCLAQNKIGAYSFSLSYSQSICKAWW